MRKHAMPVARGRVLSYAKKHRDQRLVSGTPRHATCGTQSDPRTALLAHAETAGVYRVGWFTFSVSTAQWAKRSEDRS